MEKTTPMEEEDLDRPVTLREFRNEFKDNGHRGKRDNCESSTESKSHHHSLLPPTD
jgi:hypothetical protein